MTLEGIDQWWKKLIRQRGRTIKHGNRADTECEWPTIYTSREPGSERDEVNQAERRKGRVVHEAERRKRSEPRGVHEAKYVQLTRSSEVFEVNLLKLAFQMAESWKIR
jgi:hypothetical protein